MRGSVKMKVLHYHTDVHFFSLLMHWKRFDLTFLFAPVQRLSSYKHTPAPTNNEHIQYGTTYLTESAAHIAGTENVLELRKRRRCP
jgi:hypothetical protein